MKLKVRIPDGPAMPVFFAVAFWVAVFFAQSIAQWLGDLLTRLVNG